MTSNRGFSSNLPTLPLAVLLTAFIATACEYEKGRVPLSPTPHAVSAQPTAPSRVATPASTSVPLTKEAIASCPVSLPNGKSPPPGTYASGFNLGNESKTLFTIPWVEGKVIFSPNGPGRMGADGSLEMKWPWYRTIPGDVVITGRRLDAPSPPMPSIMLRGSEDGYGETGFEPSGLLFPSPGCWEVTAALREEKLTFITLAAKLEFDPPQFLWWPSPDMLQTETDLQGFPDSIRTLWIAPSGGEIEVEVSQLPLPPPIAPSGDAVLHAAVHGNPATCFRGAPNGQGVWDANRDAGSIQWTEGSLSYRITHAGLGLDCFDMLKMAGSSI